MAEATELVEFESNYSGDSSLESDELDEAIEVNMTKLFLFQPEPISASASLTLQTVERVINLVANVSAPLQIPGTIEATTTKQARKRKLKTQQSCVKGSKKIVKITPCRKSI